ncbi:MAG: hypothetical protein M3Y07_15515 [Acidobacteriota bacterium]|nr:hypothetical protein [Acidobacteriota bacterium]
MRLPKLIPVLQHFPNRGLTDVAAAVRAELAAADAGAGLPPDSRIAIGAGSRGISNLATIVRSTVDHFRERGFEPFIVPAMGSHGGGTDQGQLDVLAHYGVTETAMGCPIESCVDAAPFGTTPDGIETYFDRNALGSDGVFVVNRVKWHTTFDAPIESGLLKMASIGLGKLQGATNYHRHGVRLGLGAVIRSVGRHVLASGKVIGGLAILEDAHHATAKVAALSAAGMEEEEEKLLALNRSWMARLLFDDIDILIVDETGKHISGVGMDSKVVNRHPYGAVNPWPWAPRIRRIYVRDLSSLSYGNAVGVGLADVISDRFYEKIDWNATKVNAMASSNLLTIKTPIRTATDKEAIEVLAAVVGRADSSEVTFAWIRNTLELSNIVISENLLASANPAGDVEVTGPAVEWPFDAAGNLTGEASAASL